MTLQLVGFGVASTRHERSELFDESFGFPHFASPQVLKRQFTTKGDIWSVGVMAYLLLCG